MYTWTHINVTKFSKERGHGFELEKQGIWECFDWGKGNKNDVNLIIISKVKNVISLRMTLLKKSYQESKKLEKKVSGIELQEEKESLFLRVIGCKIMVF